MAFQAVRVSDVSSCPYSITHKLIWNVNDTFDVFVWCYHGFVLVSFKLSCVVSELTLLLCMVLLF